MGCGPLLRGPESKGMAAFEKSLLKEFKAHETSLWHLSNVEYFCEADALKAARK